MISVLATASLALSLAAMTSTESQSVPDPFVGSWAGSAASCGSDADDLALRIDKKRIVYWASQGPIIAVVSRGTDEVALIADLTGEGQTWLATAKLTLSADGSRLIDSTTVPGTEVVRFRCQPVAEAARPN